MQQFAQTTQQAMHQLGGISNEMKKQLQEGGDYLLKLGTLTSGVVQLSNDIQSAAVALKTTNATLTDSVTNLIKPVKELASQQNNLLNAVQQSVSSLQGISDAFSNLATQQQRMGHDVESAVDDMKLAVEAFTKLAGEQNKLSGQYSTFLQHLQFEHDKQAQLATLMSDATVGLKQALSEMQNGAISLRSIAVDMNDLVRLQASLRSTPGVAPMMDLSGIINSYSNAAVAMENSGNSLTTSAIALQRASQQLRDVLSKP